MDLTRTVIMPAQCDVYGHMNVRHYSGLFNDAAWHMLGMGGVAMDDLKERGLGTVVASLTIDFHREVRAGALVLIRGAIVKVGTKSFSHELRLYETAGMTHCATQKSVEVCFDMTARAAVAFPEDMRASLAAALLDPAAQ